VDVAHLQKGCKYIFAPAAEARSWPTTTTIDLFRFEFKTVGERNKAPKLLERRGFDVELVEDLRGYVVKLPRYSKYAPVLKNSVAMIETPELVHLPDEGLGRGGGGAEAVGKAGRGGCEVLGAACRRARRKRVKLKGGHHEDGAA